MMTHFYLDESGDLGFSEGSSNYFTIAFIGVQDTVKLLRVIRKVKKKYGISRNDELKGFSTSDPIKAELLSRMSRLEIDIHSITVRKKNIVEKLRTDTNILYNYILGLLLVDRILSEEINAQICINVDKRITSVTTGFKLNEYLKYKIWYEGKRPDINMSINHCDSRLFDAIQGIDVICNSIYKKYSSNNYTFFNIIKNKVKEDRRLFFAK
jgi:hypothetical protein